MRACQLRKAVGSAWLMRGLVATVVGLCSNMEWSICVFLQVGELALEVRYALVVELEPIPHVRDRTPSPCCHRDPYVSLPIRWRLPTVSDHREVAGSGLSCLTRSKARLRSHEGRQRHTRDEIEATEALESRAPTCSSSNRRRQALPRSQVVPSEGHERAQVHSGPLEGQSHDAGVEARHVGEGLRRRRSPPPPPPRSTALRPLVGPTQSGANPAGRRREGEAVRAVEEAGGQVRGARYGGHGAVCGFRCGCGCGCRCTRASHERGSVNTWSTVRLNPPSDAREQP